MEKDHAIEPAGRSPPPDRRRRPPSARVRGRSRLSVRRRARRGAHAGAGRSALAGDDGLRVSFESVTEDSRCPMDAICVWAGRVVVDVTAGRGEARHLALSPGDAADVDGLRLRLVRVEPYPSAAEPIPASAYRATFVVDRP